MHIMNFEQRHVEHAIWEFRQNHNKILKGGKWKHILSAKVVLGYARSPRFETQLGHVLFLWPDLGPCLGSKHQGHILWVVAYFWADSAINLSAPARIFGQRGATCRYW